MATTDPHDALTDDPSAPAEDHSAAPATSHQSAGEPVDPFVPLRRSGLKPVPELAQLRESEPVRRVEFPFGIHAWIVSGYDAVRAVLGDSKSFSNDFGRLASAMPNSAPRQQNPGGLGMSDPPVHTRLRKMLTPEFTVRRLRRLTPQITEIVDDLLDAMTNAGPPIDLVEHFAMPLPSLVICELLGVPYPDRAAFAKLSGARFDIFGGAGTGLDAITESLAYMSELVAAQRRAPGDGLLGMLIRDHGDEIDDVELAGLADGVLIGGHETTASMLALGTIALLRSTEGATIMREGDPLIVRDAVEELLRYLSVVQVAFPRFARADIVISGRQIRAGELVLCSLSGANQDPALGDGMQDLELHRSPRQHVAFGHGIHRCIGSELARMELRIAFPALFRRFPALRIDVPWSDVRFREYSVVFGVDTLPVAW